LAQDDKDHAGFDDVRSALIGIAECQEVGITRWLGSTLSSSLVKDKPELSRMVERGLAEIQAFFTATGVR
jgi:copper homeostasis protein CutC